MNPDSLASELGKVCFYSPFGVLYLGYRVKFLKLIILWGDIYSVQSSCIQNHRRQLILCVGILEGFQKDD